MITTIPDDALLAACLHGDETAWAALVARYKNLVYSVPLRYRLSPEDAADVFQSVWMELYSDLANLRNTGALRSWLLTVAAHKCYQLKRRQAARREDATPELESLGATLPAEWHTQLEQEQILREAISGLPERCQTLVRLLFYSDPPLAYSQIAKKLGLAEGSIGFIRGRCLQKLKRILEESGF